MLISRLVAILWRSARVPEATSSQQLFLLLELPVVDRDAAACPFNPYLVIIFIVL